MATGITVIKSFTYRGQPEEWSNHYHLTGTTPTTSAAWRTLFDALVAAEKTLYSSGCTVVAGYGYDDDAATAHAVWSVDLTVSPNTPVAGTLTTTGGTHAPGDSAMWARWKLARNNVKGKAVYLRKYFHDVWIATSSSGVNADNILSAQATALANFAALLDTGAGVGGEHLRDTGGAAIIAHGSSTFVTTRTLKRRGKRPS